MSDQGGTQGTLFMVSAPSGAGKTSLVNALVERVPGMAVSVSHTTRPPRVGEKDGHHYHFVDEEAFEGMVRAGRFLEHARVFKHRYGTGGAQVLESLHAGTDVVVEIDWQGARQLGRALPDAVGIFVLPPSVEVLLERLHRRGLDAPTIIEQRMAEAHEELSHYDEYDYLVVNADFEQALADMIAIVRARRLRRSSQATRHAVLLNDLFHAGD